jgi:VCBS repeat-containing protein
MSSELFLNLHQNFNSPRNSIFIFGEANEEVHIKNSNGYDETVTLDADGFFSITVPNTESMTGTGVNGQGLQITSEGDIAAYLSSRQTATSDLTVIFDKSTLEKGNHYVLASMGNSIGEGGQFSAQATEDNTLINVQLPNGESFEQALNKGETFKFATAPSAANTALGVTTSTGFDLTGTTINSNKPIAVFSGHNCTNIGSGACDFIVEQMPPTNVLLPTEGETVTTYVVGESHSDTGLGNNLVRVIAAQDGTQVTVGGTLVATLAAGQFHAFTLSDPSAVITTTKGALVAQYLQGAITAGEGDPAMTFVPPVNSWLSEYKLATPLGAADEFDKNLVNVVIPTGALSSLTINGLAADTSAFVDVPGTGFMVGNIEIEPGIITIKAGDGGNDPDTDFQVSIFGYDFFDSYLTFGAADFAPPPVNFAPVANNDSYNLGTGATLTANAAAGALANDTDINGDVLTALLVDDPDHGTLTLNADGSFTYTHDGSGTLSDSFTYKANDGDLESSPATVTLTITPPDNAAPIAFDDVATTLHTDTVTLFPLSNDSDSDSDPLSLLSVAGNPATNGSEYILPSGAKIIIGADGAVTYDPNGAFDSLAAGETATDSFAYSVSDGALSDDGVITVTIQGEDCGCGGETCITDGTDQSDILIGSDDCNDLIRAYRNTDLLQGLGGKDTLEGGTSGDTLEGGDGYDWLLGGSGDDLLDGGDDADLLRGEGWRDTLYGGEGNDSLDGGQSEDLLYGGFGNDTLDGGHDKDVLYGEEGDDLLDGYRAHDLLEGGSGLDTLLGGTGDDTLGGGRGDDDLRGEDDHDVLKGDSGNDTLTGGRGADTLFGGEGSDTFVYALVSNSTTKLSAGNGVDMVGDFEDGLDRIDLSLLTFTGLDADGGATESGELRLSYDAVADITYALSDQNSFTLGFSGNLVATLDNADFVF